MLKALELRWLHVILESGRDGRQYFMLAGKRVYVDSYMKSMLRTEEQIKSNA